MKQWLASLRGGVSQTPGVGRGKLKFGEIDWRFSLTYLNRK